MDPVIVGFMIVMFVLGWCGATVLMPKIRRFMDRPSDSSMVEKEGEKGLGMSKKEHLEFGLICDCHCHNDGTNIRECFFTCCRLYRKKYQDENGVLDEERLRALFKEKGFEPEWLKDLKPMPKFERFEFPVIKQPFSSFNWTVDFCKKCGEYVPPMWNGCKCDER
jgi:hypothetical protein